MSSSSSHGNHSQKLPWTSSSSSILRSHESGLIPGSILSNVRKLENSDIFRDIQEFLDILHNASIPGPRLLRMKRELNKRVGRGAQGHVHVANDVFDSHLARLERDLEANSELKTSVQAWRSCAIKQLRHDTKNRLESQVASALSEVRQLCRPTLRNNPNIVNLQGWGLCLDSLENELVAPRLPLLIFERAVCDLALFIESSKSGYADLIYSDLQSLALNIGQGLQAIHDVGIVHGDMKLDNILLFYNKNPVGDEKKWLAKICDFGSTRDSSTTFASRHYLGTNGWKPPETLESSAEVDGRLCDIFAYGLVVWALFVGLPRSPIENFHIDDTISSIGRHETYFAAKKQITSIYPKVNEKQLDHSVHDPEFKGPLSDETYRARLRALQGPSFVAVQYSRIQPYLPNWQIQKHLPSFLRQSLKSKAELTEQEEGQDDARQSMELPYNGTLNPDLAKLSNLRERSGIVPSRDNRRLEDSAQELEPAGMDKAGPAKPLLLDLDRSADSKNLKRAGYASGGNLQPTPEPSEGCVQPGDRADSNDRSTLEANVNGGPGGSNSRVFAQLAIQRVRMLMPPPLFRAAVTQVKVDDFGPKANRLLELLCCTLHDDPRHRSRHPWNVLQTSYEPHPVQDPEIFKASLRDTGAPKTVEREIVAMQGMQSLKIFKLVRDHVKERCRHLWPRLQDRLPMLLPASPRQRLFQKYHLILSGLLGADPSATMVLTHPDSGCLDLSARTAIRFDRLIKARGLKYSQSISVVRDVLGGSLEDGEGFFDDLYALARLRSRFPSCCWTNLLASIRSGPIIEYLLADVELNATGEILAWAFRNKTSIYFDGFALRDLCRFLSPGLYNLTDEQMTSRLLILLDCDLYLGQDSGLYPRQKRSIFEAYLRKLREPSHALQLCRHFKRISSSDFATLQCKHWYTGLLGDDFYDPSSPGAELFWTTSLHDAVRAANFLVVSFLSKSGFNLATLDSDNRTALDVAEDMLHDGSIGTNDLRYAALQRILVLFLEDPRFRRERSRLPQGWEPIVVDRVVETDSEIVVEKRLRGFVECSVPAIVKPITFRTPRLSLLEDRKIALAEHAHPTSGAQTFFLNPLRFLRDRQDVVHETGEEMHATTKTLTEDYFRLDVQRTLKPEPQKPARPGTFDSQHGSRYSQYLIKQPLALLIYLTIFCALAAAFVARLLGARHSQVIFASLAAGGLVSFLARHIMMASSLFMPLWAAEEASGLATNAFDFLIGIWALKYQNLSMLRYTLVGSWLSNNLLLFGGCLILAGSRFDLEALPLPSPFLSSGLVGVTFSILLFVLENTTSAAAVPGVATLLSVSVSVFCLLLSVAYFFFRHFTHAELFECYQSDTVSVDERKFEPWPEGIDIFTARQGRRGLSKNIWPGTIGLIGLLVATECVVNGLSGLEAQQLLLFAAFVVPVIARVFYAIHLVRCAADNRINIIIGLTIAPSRRVTMVLAPLWALCSRLGGSSFNLSLDGPAIALYAFSSWFLVQLFGSAALGALKGLSAVGLWFALGLAIFLG